MKAKTFDKQFDAGVDITATLDLSKARRVLQEQKRVNVDFPKWMIASLDREAENSALPGNPQSRCGLLNALKNQPLKSPSAGRCAINPHSADEFGRCAHICKFVPLWLSPRRGCAGFFDHSAPRYEPISSNISLYVDRSATTKNRQA